MSQSPFYCLAFGLGTKNAKNQWLEVFYQAPVFGPNPALLESVSQILGYEGGNRDLEINPEQAAALEKNLSSLPVEYQSQVRLLARLKTSTRPMVACFLESDEAPASTPQAYLKLHLLSLRHVKPNHTNLEGIFALLPNVAWTSKGAIDLEELADAQLEARLKGDVLEVSSVDKFPKMTNYVMPAGVRIAHTARVRLGAYLGEGTTVMHEGFVNFNAGTLGTGMIEGRISQGVTLDEGSDLGGGASTAGTLSGGGNIILSIGKACLISANAGTGIPLGDRCIIEAGLYITPGTVVQLMDENRKPFKTVKARELAGQSDMLFIRNSQTGVVECRSNQKAIALNTALHSHN